MNRVLIALAFVVGAATATTYSWQSESAGFTPRTTPLGTALGTLQLQVDMQPLSWHVRLINMIEREHLITVKNHGQVLWSNVTFNNPTAVVDIDSTLNLQYDVRAKRLCLHCIAIHHETPHR